MAGNTSTFTLKIETKGMPEAQKGSQQVRDNLEAAQAAAAGIRVTGTAAPGTAGARKVASSAAAMPTGAAGASAGISGTEVESYNRARGAAGAAGGSARDFADQARGLGGLVRLYATFAANIFAVTAAFNALSSAMDTANMVKGLDQIGAASGMALGTLSKELVRATDGAISLREAMEATAKATSAGLSSAQVIELGKAATKASQALGLNLTDAVSRLSRGISKIEPELLDELGIYVKIDDAVQKYARSLGKTASSLTDYERRQAFATEALSQANKKFGEIELDTNPYTKLSAALKDLAQSAGEFINNFVAPVVKYLSQSPVALALAVGLVVKTIIKQAIPAFGEYKNSLQEATVKTAQKAKELLKIQNDLAEARDESAASGAVSALKESQAMKARLDQLKATSQTFSKTTRVDYSAIANVDPFAINEADFASLEKKLERRAKTVARTNAAEAQAIREHIAELKAIRQEADNAATAAQARVEQRDNKFYTQQTVTRVRAERAMRQLNRASILEEANKTQSLEGARAAWRKLNEELAKPQRQIKVIDPNTGEEISTVVKRTEGLFGSIERGSVRARGALGIAFQSVTDFAEAWGPKISMAIGIAVAAFEILDSVFSTNKKQLEEFSQATEAANNAVKLVDDTLKRIAKQDLGDALLPQNIEARAKAFTELSDTIEKTADSFQEVNKASSWWDNLVDSIKGLAGRGRLDQLGKTLAKQINSALESVSLDDKSALENKLKSILDTTDLDASSVVAALDKAGREGGALLAEQIGKSVKQASDKAAADAAKLKEALAVFDNINKSYQDLANSLRDTSPLSSFASALIQGSIDAQQALSNTNNTISYFRELLKDPKKLRLFDESSIRIAKGYQTELDKAAKAVQTIETELKKTEKAFEQTFGEAQVNEIGVLIVPTIDEAKQEELRNKIQEGLKAKATLELNVEGIKGKLAGILEQPLIKGMQIATQEFQKGMQKVQLDVIGNLISKLSGTGRAEAEFQLQKERIEIEKASISAMYELVRAVEKNSITIKQVDTEKALRERGEKLGTAGGLQIKDTEYLRLETQFKELQAGAGILDKGLKLTSADFEKLRKTFPNVAKELISFFQSTMGTKGKFAQQEGQQRIAEISRDFGRSEETFKTSQEQKKADLELLNIAKDRAAILSNIYGLENKSLIVSKQLAASKAEEKAQEMARAEIVEKISQAEFAQKKLNQEKAKQGKNVSPALEAALTLAENTVKEERERLKLFNQQAAEKTRLVELQNKLEKISSETAAEQKKLEFDKQRADAAFELQQLSSNADKQELDNLVSRGRLEEDYAAERIAQLALEAQQTLYNKQLSDAASQKRLQDLQAEDQFRKAIAASGDELAATVTRDRQLANNNALFTDRLRIINDTNTFAQRGIEIEKSKALETAKTNKLLEEQKDRAELIASLGDSLAAAFGKFGSSLTGFLTALNNMTTAQETYNNKLSEQYDIMDESRKLMDDPGKSEKQRADAAAAYAKAQKETNKLEKQNARDELANQAKLIGATKSLFKEKTFAYKALAAIEKAIHIAKIAMTIKEMLVDKASVATTVANSGAKMAAKGVEAGVDGVAAVVKSIASLPFPFNIAAGALVAGVVAKLLSSIGQKGPSVSAGGAGTTSADRQETQGTGMTWVDGKKVETGGGVFGDPQAKTAPITQSLERIRETNVDGVFENRKMVRLLQSIDRSIGNAAKGLFSIPGLRTGSRFNTIEGTQSGGGLFGTGFLASKTSTAIQDSGVVIKGTFRQLAGEVSGAIVGLYEDVLVTTRKWYGKKKTSLKRNFDELPEALNYINDVFSTSAEMFVDLGKQLGVGKDAVWRSLDSLGALDFEGSLRGLKGEDFDRELEAIIGNQLDRGATAVFGEIVTRFREFGESALQTVIRVVDETEKGLQSLGNISAAFGKAFRDQLREEIAKGTITKITTTPTGTANAVTEFSQEELTRMWETGELYFDYALMQVIRRTEGFASAVTENVTRPLTEAEVAIQEAAIIQDIAKYFGDAETGFDNFLDSVESFRDNFLTETERLEPIREMVDKELAALNLSFIKTRQDFKETVQFLLDATNPLGIASANGRELVATLLQLAPAFAEITKEADKTVEDIAPEDLVKRINDTRVKALQLMAQISGKEEDARNVVLLQRELELAELQKYPKIQREILENNQKYIYALEDELSAKEKLVKRRDQLKSTIDNISRAIDTLANYKKTLLAGDLSTLLPIDKYQEAKTQFEDLLATINKTPVTEAEKAAQLEAVNRLPQVSDALLQASRVVNASSGAYVSDFEAVTAALEATTGVLTDRRTDAQKQIDSIVALGIPLDSIAASSETTAELIQDYLTARDAAIGFGIRVGEQATAEDTPSDIAAALANLSTEFKNFREAMMGADGFRAVTTALTGPDGVANKVTTALTGPEGVGPKVTSALTGGTNSVAAQVTAALTGGTNSVAAQVTAALTGPNGVAPQVTGALTGPNGVGPQITGALTGTGGVKDALLGENGVVGSITEALTGNGGVRDALIGDQGVALIVKEALVGADGVADRFDDAVRGEDGLGDIVRNNNNDTLTQVAESITTAVNDVVTSNTTALTEAATSITEAVAQTRVDATETIAQIVDAVSSSIDTDSIVQALVGPEGVAQVVHDAITSTTSNVVSELSSVATAVMDSTAQSARETGAIVQAVTSSGNFVADAVVDTASLSESLGSYYDRTAPIIESGSYGGGGGRNLYEFTVVSAE